MPNFTAEDVLRVIKSAKNSTAIGPDGLATAGLIKYIGEKGASYLAKTFNLCLKTLTIPEIWKTAKIVPIPKPVKQVHHSTSYRPITLMSAVIKVLEFLILPELQENIQLADHQHGFRAGGSTTTALCEIAVQIAKGLNMKRPNDRSILVALELSKAFDLLSHDKLLDDVCNTMLPNQFKLWLLVFMTGR